MDNQPNKDYMINSLVNQNSRLSVQIAERDAIITEQQQEIQKLQQEQVDKMNEETPKQKKTKSISAIDKKEG